MERAFTCAFPHLRDTPSGEVSVSGNSRSNIRLALILASVAAVFFAGVIAKYVIFPS